MTACSLDVLIYDPCVVTMHATSVALI
jgi:hypothetical protein